MVQTIGINVQNDIYLGSDGNIVVLYDIAAIENASLTACRTSLGECVLQQGTGLPNFQLAWVGTPDIALWETYLENTLLNIEGVTQVDSVRITVQENNLGYIAKIQTIFGPTTING